MVQYRYNRSLYVARQGDGVEDNLQPSMREAKGR